MHTDCCGVGLSAYNYDLNFDFKLENLGMVTGRFSGGSLTDVILLIREIIFVVFRPICVKIAKVLPGDVYDGSVLSLLEPLVYYISVNMLKEGNTDETQITGV